jgi:hypothetical protein
MDLMCGYIHFEERVPEPTKEEIELAQSFSDVVVKTKITMPKPGINL